MNDFTKDELEDLISWADVYTEFGRSWTDKVHRPLIDKIQCMIDNYCEHEYGKSVYGCIDCGITEYRCNKCAHISYEGLK